MEYIMIELYKSPLKKATKKKENKKRRSFYAPFCY